MLLLSRAKIFARRASAFALISDMFLYCFNELQQAEKANCRFLVDREGCDFEPNEFRLFGLSNSMSKNGREAIVYNWISIILISDMGNSEGSMSTVFQSPELPETAKVRFLHTFTEGTKTQTIAESNI